MCHGPCSIVLFRLPFCSQKDILGFYKTAEELKALVLGCPWLSKVHQVIHPKLLVQDLVSGWRFSKNDWRGLGRRGEAPVGAQGLGDFAPFWRCRFGGDKADQRCCFWDFKWFMKIFARDIIRLCKYDKYDTLNKETRNLPSHHHHVYHSSYPSLRNAL